MIPPNAEPIQDELTDLDARISALGADIWIGAEPTFTDRYSESAEWLQLALGGEKEARAAELLRDFSTSLPGCALLRTIGRQYPGEPSARWSLGGVPQKHGMEVRRERTDGAKATWKMRVGPSESAFRSRLQTTPSCCV